MAIDRKKAGCMDCGEYKYIYAKKKCEWCYKNERNKVYAKRQKDKPLNKPRKKINQVSKKQAKKLGKYFKIRAEFMNKPANKYCPVTGKLTTDVHHKKGKIGYADKWARDNNIPLLIDVRFFLAVSREGHDKIENNPEWAYKMGYSIKRLKDEN